MITVKFFSYHLILQDRFVANTINQSLFSHPEILLHTLLSIFIYPCLRVHPDYLSLCECDV